MVGWSNAMHPTQQKFEVAAAVYSGLCGLRLMIVGTIPPPKFSPQAESRGGIFHLGGGVFIWVEFSVKKRRRSDGGGLALLSIEVTIGIIAEHCRALRYLPWTISPP